MSGLPCQSTTTDRCRLRRRSAGTAMDTALYGGGIPWLITVILMEPGMGVTMPALSYTSVYDCNNRHIIRKNCILNI